MIEPLTPEKDAPSPNVDGFGTPTPTPTPTPTLCATCACSFFFGDAAQNQFSVQVTNTGVF